MTAIDAPPVCDRFLKELEDRLLRDVRIDTTADRDSTASPSSRIQFDLLEVPPQRIHSQNNQP